MFDSKVHVLDHPLLQHKLSILRDERTGVEEIVEAMESGAEVESLQKTIYQGENHDISLMDRIPEKENGQEKLLNRIFLEELLGRLPAKERQLIYMRYFQDMTQAQIAGKLGISQVQVSRMEKKILRQMRMEKV